MRKLSNKQEKEVAKALEGKVVINSGATKWKKGDVDTSEEKIECKITTKDSYTLKFDDLVKIRTQAIKDDCKEPLFIFEFKDISKYIITFVTKEEAKDITVFQTLKSMTFERDSLELAKKRPTKKKGKPISYFGFVKDNRTYFCAVWDFYEWLDIKKSPFEE